MRSSVCPGHSRDVKSGPPKLSLQLHKLSFERCGRISVGVGIATTVTGGLRGTIKLLGLPHAAKAFAGVKEIGDTLPGRTACLEACVTMETLVRRDLTRRSATLRDEKGGAPSRWRAVFAFGSGRKRASDNLLGCVSAGVP